MKKKVIYNSLKHLSSKSFSEDENVGRDIRNNWTEANSNYRVPIETFIIIISQNNFWDRFCYILYMYILHNQIFCLIFNLNILRETEGKYAKNDIYLVFLESDHDFSAREIYMTFRWESMNWRVWFITKI